MKKFTKLLLSCAAIAALSATVAISAMAEETAANTVEFEVKNDQVTVDAEYNTETGKITFTAPADMKVSATKKDATYVVYPSGVTAPADNDIVGIDQSADGLAFDKGLKSTVHAPAEGEENPTTYTVRVGYYDDQDVFRILEGTLFSAGVMVGDASQDDDIMINDAVLIVDHLNGKELTGDALKAADASQDGDIMINDAVLVVDFLNGKTDNGVGVVK